MMVTIIVGVCVCWVLWVVIVLALPPSYQWLTDEDVNSGNYEGWLRVEIVKVSLREARNGRDFITVVYHSLDENFANRKKRWKVLHNYFGIGVENNRMAISLGEAVGFGHLNHDNIGRLIGKQLEIRVGIVYRQGQNFVDAINHQGLSGVVSVELMEGVTLEVKAG